MTHPTDIGVKSFRLLYQWPLFIVPGGGETDLASIRTCVEDTRKLLETGDAGWSEVDPLDYPGFDERTDKHDGLSPAYGEFLYFHDFVQRFLFRRGPDHNPTFWLFENTRFKTASCKLDKKQTVDFKVVRHSLHLYPSGIAMVSVELCATDLTLAAVMSAMDKLRRSYVPYFKGDTAGDVPEMVTLRGCKSVLVSQPPEPRTAHDFLNKDKRNQPNLRPTILDHWKAFAAPLELLGDGGQWRDLSDERLPFNAFISLKSAGAKPEDDRNAVLQISKGDWMRLAEVDGPEEKPDEKLDEKPDEKLYAYNPDFLEPLGDQAFYDRFFPHADTGDNAARHIFSATHYCAVGAGWFVDTLMIDHWRRHYAHLTLIARFELASLLAISSRMSQIAHDYDPCCGPHKKPAIEKTYEEALLDVQSQFSLFEHRFRFTGVSSQIQPAEMFDKLRAAMGLDAIYEDVKNEVAQAAAQVMALQQTRAANAATQLNQLAAIGLFLALVVSAAGMNLFVGLDYGNVPTGGVWDHAMQFAAIVAVSAVSFAILLKLIREDGSDFLTRFFRLLMMVAGAGVLAYIILWLFT